MGIAANAAESGAEQQERLWRDASLAAWKARREYEALADSDAADERSVELLWLKLWRADRACEALLSGDDKR